MDSKRLTLEYYSRWLGIAPSLMEGRGVSFVFNPLRDEVPAGYSRRFDVYAFLTADMLALSYGTRAEGEIDRLKGAIGEAAGSAEAVAEAIGDVFGKKPSRQIKFIYTNRVPYGGGAIRLEQGDFPRYREFFLALNPGAKDILWLEEYFCEIAAKGLCFAVEGEGGRLLSMTNAPDMPFMAEKVQELGINTLPEARGKGLAKTVCLAMIEAIIAQGKCPQWSTALGNEASRRLAFSLGFEKLADVFTLSVE